MLPLFNSLASSSYIYTLLLLLLIILILHPYPTLSSVDYFLVLVVGCWLLSEGSLWLLLTAYIFVSLVYGGTIVVAYLFYNPTTTSSSIYTLPLTYFLLYTLLLNSLVYSFTTSSSFFIILLMLLSIEIDEVLACFCSSFSLFSLVYFFENIFGINLGSFFVDSMVLRD